MNLFRNIDFIGHSGQPLSWKIECNELMPEDWEWAAARVAERVSFWDVTGIPYGGLPFADALRPYANGDGTGVHLLVDDVLTTGRSMMEHKSIYSFQVLGIVLFARIPPPEPWIKALFVMPEW